MFDDFWFDAELIQTDTSKEQCTCEKECAEFLRLIIDYDSSTIERLKSNGVINQDMEMRLVRSKHISYLMHNLNAELPSGFVSLDASRPWICYWIIHALYLLGKELPPSLAERVISTLQYIRNSTGGYGGGPLQLSQGAPNYASILALCSIGTVPALESIDRVGMYHFFMSIKHESGGFCIHRDGEVDSRGTYTIIAIARLLNILTNELVEGTAEYLLNCQTYEGGFGGEPGNEAHGGYNFCAVAALLILKQAHRINLHALESWLLRRQMRLEGGFQGRTNKLVDSCYSFWQGAALGLVDVIKHNGTDTFDLQCYLGYNSSSGDMDMESCETVNGSGLQIRPVTAYSGVLSFNQMALQRYILHCAQNVDHGGMRDKPGKMRDFYHSCYSLSGLAVAQSSVTTFHSSCSDFQKSYVTTIIDDDDVDNILPCLDDGYTGPQVNEGLHFMFSSFIFIFLCRYMVIWTTCCNPLRSCSISDCSNLNHAWNISHNFLLVILDWFQST